MFACGGSDRDWSEEVTSFLADARPRSYCVQYGESDYAQQEVPLGCAFVSRLLAEEGIGWYVDANTETLAGHRLRLFADSLRLPEDTVSTFTNGG